MSNIVEKFDEEAKNNPSSFPAFLQFSYEDYQTQLRLVDDLRARIAELEDELAHYKLSPSEKWQRVLAGYQEDKIEKNDALGKGNENL